MVLDHYGMSDLMGDHFYMGHKHGTYFYAVEEGDCYFGIRQIHRAGNGAGREAVLESSCSYRPATEDGGGQLTNRD